MRLYLIMLATTILSCGYNEEITNNEPSPDDQAINMNTVKSINNKVGESISVWICNHPGTKQHNTLCVEELYPMGCFVEGDSSKFCWLLTDEACDQERNHDAEWQNFCDTAND